MTAHGHLSSPPSLCTIDQIPQVGAPHQWAKVMVLITAFWNDCKECQSPALTAAIADGGAFLALWRVCILQETGSLRRPYGSAEADAELGKLHQFDRATLHKLAEAGARTWVTRARVFDQIRQISDGEGRVLQRPEAPGPGSCGRTA